VDVYSIRADYRFMYKKVRMETGAKSSLVKTETEAYYDSWNNNAWEYDTIRSNHFVYHENINALYTNASFDMGEKWSVQSGLRAEQTLARGEQSVHNQTFTRNYISLFPTAFVTYKADSNHQLELNYGRRIQRPEYRSLNPFIKFASKYVYEMGNPTLLPQFSDRVELKHNYKNKLFTSVMYTHTSNIRQINIVIDEQTKISYSRPENIATNDIVSMWCNYNKELKKGWQFSSSASVFYTLYKGKLNQKTININGMGYSFDINNQFTFKKSWGAEVVISYTGTSRDALLWTSGPWLYTGIGVSKKYLHDRLQVKLNIEDPFYLSTLYMHVKWNDLESDARIKFYTQLCRITVSWNFGDSYSIKQQNTGIKDEADRIK
jgi:iron complex outermembrane recepter protein